MKNKLIKTINAANVSIVAIIAELILVLCSWITSSIRPELHIRSLLSSEGIRWLAGNATENISSPFLIWIILLTIACGTMGKCGIIADVVKKDKSFRSRIGFMLALVELFAVTTVMVMLTTLPHAILLSVSGELYPSRFSDCIIPVACLTLTIVSTTYGIVTNRYKTTRAWFDSLTFGIKKSACYIVAYIFLMQLYCSIRFVAYL